MPGDPVRRQVSGQRGRREGSAVVMPIDTYRLYQAERGRSAAEFRAADDELGRLGASLARLLGGSSRSRQQGPVTRFPAGRPAIAGPAPQSRAGRRR